MEGTADLPVRAGHAWPFFCQSNQGFSPFSQDRMMSRQDANAALALTSFLYGSNAAYIEDLYARYEADPASVDAEWRDFFASLKDNAADVTKGARGASWKRPNWPQPERGDLVAALDGDWQEIGKTLGDKVKARAQAA